MKKKCTDSRLNKYIQPIISSLCLLAFAVSTVQQHREFVDGFPIARDPPKDGNCQFHALCDQLQNIGIFTTHEKLRDDIVSYIRDHPRLSNCDTSLENFLTTDINTYLSKMQRNGTYGDHITLTAAAALYTMQIVVISDNKEGVRTKSCK